MTKTLTDAEVICRWMDAAPWSVFWGGVCKWASSSLTLDALWEVQQRLDDEQWWVYCNQFAPSLYAEGMTWRHEYRRCLNATPEQKIKALATVLRPLVEAE